MNESHSVQTPSLRIWPLVVILAIQWLMMLVPGWLAPATTLHFIGGFFGPFAGALAVIAWWLFFSRVSRTERWLGLLIFLATVPITFILADRSFEVPWLLLHGLPIVTTGLGIWLVLTPWLSWPARRAGMLVVLALTWGFFTLVRHGGMDGNFAAAFPWRWTLTAEERFLAERDAGRAAPVAVEPSVVLAPGDWPGFRGKDRDGRLAGVRIATDWDKQAPRLLWKKLVGPGWSSFAVVGSRIYTQEQRGSKEAVVCYDAETGAELWAHQDETRFSETMGGPGPRATPTFHDGKIYAQGATGKLNCLDAASGQPVWSRDVAADAGASVPQWGYAASPLVQQGVVIVFAGGGEGKSVAGYDAATGTPLWSAGEGNLSYSSPQPAHVFGVEQLVVATNLGLAAYEPKRGEVLWKHDWPLDRGMSRVVQPARIGDADFLVGTGFGVGTRRVHVRRDSDAVATDAVWTSRAIKPYYNDFVVHGDHIYGFDHHFLTCVSLADGKSAWRERGYGNGQVLLLADQDLLVVTSETGEVALVDAVPGAHQERARIQALEGKTWNHPVIAHGKLFVRNGKEAACYLLPMQ